MLKRMFFLFLLSVFVGSSSTFTPTLALAGELSDLKKRISTKITYQTFEHRLKQKLSFHGCQLQIEIVDTHLSLESTNSQHMQTTSHSWDLKIEHPTRSQKKITLGEKVIQLWGIQGPAQGESLYFTQEEKREQYYQDIKRTAELCKAKEMVFPKRQGPCRSLVSEVREIRENLADFSDQIKMFLTSFTRTLAPSYVEKAIFKAVNDYRQEKGLPALKWSSQLAHLARLHGQDMERREQMDHQNFQQRAQKIREMGPFKGVVENVAYNFGKENPALSAFQQWQRSPGHEVNMRKTWSEDQEGYTGVNAFRSQDGHWYFTQISAGRLKTKK